MQFVLQYSAGFLINPCSAELIIGNIKFYLYNHFSQLRWCRYCKSFLKEDGDLFISYSQHQGCYLLLHILIYFLLNMGYLFPFYIKKPCWNGTGSSMSSPILKTRISRNVMVNIIAAYDLVNNKPRHQLLWYWLSLNRRISPYCYKAEWLIQGHYVDVMTELTMYICITRLERVKFIYITKIFQNLYKI